MNSSVDWLLVLLERVDTSTHSNILFLFWRAWPLRNDVIFGEEMRLSWHPLIFWTTIGPFFPLSFTISSSVLEVKDKSLVFHSNLVTNQLLEVCCGSHFRSIVALT